MSAAVVNLDEDCSVICRITVSSFHKFENFQNKSTVINRYIQHVLQGQNRVSLLII